MPIHRKVARGSRNAHHQPVQLGHSLDLTAQPGRIGQPKRQVKHIVFIVVWLWNALVICLVLCVVGYIAALSTTQYTQPGGPSAHLDDNVAGRARQGSLTRPYCVHVCRATSTVCTDRRTFEVNVVGVRDLEHTGA